MTATHDCGERIDNKFGILELQCFNTERNGVIAKSNTKISKAVIGVIIQDKLTL